MREFYDLNSPAVPLPPAVETLLLIAIEFRLLGGAEPNGTADEVQTSAAPVDP
jgi:hypothetical protein